MATVLVHASVLLDFAWCNLKDDKTHAAFSPGACGSNLCSNESANQVQVVALGFLDCWVLELLVLLVGCGVG